MSPFGSTNPNHTQLHELEQMQRGPGNVLSEEPTEVRLEGDASFFQIALQVLN